MKKLLQILFLGISGWLSLELSAQQYPVQVNMTITPPYSLYLSDYTAPESNSLQVLINVMELDRTNLRAKLRVTLEGAGITLKTKPSYLPQPIVLQGGVPELLTSYELRHYLNPDNLDFSGISREEFIRSGKLPEGFYSLSVEVLDYNRNLRISNLSTANAWLVLNDPPFINAPFNGSKPKATDPQNIMFSWTPRHTASPNSAFTTEYEFRLVEMYPGQSNPDIAIRSSNSIYTTTTTQTALNYGVIEPLLVPGKQYAFRIRAYDTRGRDLFKNDGYSETYMFQYGDACILPTGIDAEALDPNRVKVQWEPSQVHSSFTVFFRMTDEDGWYTYDSFGEGQIIPDLVSGVTYEYQIQPQCATIKGKKSAIYTIRTPEIEVGEFACGADMPKFDFNQTPLNQPLKYRDIIKISDWMIRVETSETKDNATYSGTGFAMVPLFKLASIRVKFDKITINEDYRVIAGEVHTVYSEDSRFIVDATKDDEEIDDETSSEETNSDEPDVVLPGGTPIVVEGTVDTVYHNENGEIVVVSTDGTTIVQAGGATSITDAVGNEYAVDDEGNISTVGGTGAPGSDAGAGGIAGGGNTAGGESEGKDQYKIHTYKNPITAIYFGEDGDLKVKESITEHIISDKKIQLIDSEETVFKIILGKKASTDTVKADDSGAIRTPEEMGLISVYDIEGRVDGLYMKATGSIEVINSGGQTTVIRSLPATIRDKEGNEFKIDRGGLEDPVEEIEESKNLFSQYNFGANEDNTYSFVTPSGGYLVLPENVENVKIFFGYQGASASSDNAQYQQFLMTTPGTLKSFDIGEITYTAKIVGSGESAQLKGYFDANDKAYNSTTYGIVDPSESYEDIALMIIFDFDRGGTSGGLFIEKINFPNLQAFSGSAPLKALFDAPERSMTDTHRLDETQSGSFVSLNNEILYWAFKDYSTFGNTYLIRNKIAEMKSIFPELVEEMTSQYQEWSADNVCDGGAQFEDWLRDQYCDRKVEQTYGAYDTGIRYQLKNGAQLPQNTLEWCKLFYDFLKTGVEKHRELVALTLSDLNKNPDQVLGKTRDELIKVLNTASSQDVQKLSKDAILAIISHILNDFWVSENKKSHLNEEGAIIKLLKDSNPSIHGDLLVGLEGNNRFKKEEFLFEQLFRGIDDEAIFFPIGNDNRKKLVAELAKMVLGASDFYDKRMEKSLSDLGKHSIIMEYNGFWVAIGKTVVYSSSINSVLRFAGNNVVEENLKTYDVDYRFLANENKVELTESEEIGFANLRNKTPLRLRPFDLVYFLNQSNLSAVDELMSEAKLTDIPLPAVVVMYAANKAGATTINDGIGAAIDVGSLALSGGSLLALRGAGKVLQARKAFMLADMSSSGLSITASTLQYDQENKSISEFLRVLSTVTAILSMGDLSIDAVQKLRGMNSFDERVDAVMGSASNMSQLPSKQQVEVIMDVFKKMTSEDIATLVSKYPQHTDNALSIAIKYLKDGVGTKNASKIAEARDLLTKIGEAMKNRSNPLSGFNITNKGKQLMISDKQLSEHVVGAIDGVKQLQEIPGLANVSELNIYGTTFEVPKGGIKVYQQGGTLVTVAPGFCFPAGTPVRLKDGVKPVEAIQEGDRVLSYDHATQTRKMNRVTQLFKRTTHQLTKLIVGGTLLMATPEHQVFANGGYHEVQSLHPGDTLCDANGAYHLVEKVTTKDTTLTVYNFEVESAHNYYVGELALLAHNACNLPKVAKKLEGVTGHKLPQLKARLDAIKNLDPDVRAAFTTKINDLDDPKVIKTFLDDFAENDAAIAEFLKKPELVDSWRKMFDLGDAIPDAIKRNPDVLSKTQNWSDDLYSKLGAVKDKNPTFFDRINDNPQILEFFEEGSSFISNKSGNLKAVDLDMYALDRSRKLSPDATPIIDDATLGYVQNTTRKNLADMDINAQSGKIRDANGNVLNTDNVNGEGLMYVIDESDNIIIGGRGGTISYPHPTLIGGVNPNVKSAGMIRFKDGRILEINNNSGHFKPSNSVLQQAEQIFRQKMPANSFDSGFKVTSF